jgi:dTDP-4-amino-4,6-dideoxygalactose transaminase
MTTEIKFLDLHRQYQEIRGEVDTAIANVIAEAAFISGPYARSFEQEFARYLGAAHCVGVGNGTDALEIAFEALDLPAGSEVIVPANSFIASSEAVTRSGLRVVFCACDRRNYTLDLADVRARITPATSAIVAVHLYGHPCDMDSLRALAAEFGLRIIEDCAQAHGSEYRQRRVGTLGDLACFSFYPGKNLGAYGDGGAIVAQDAGLAERCRMIANHGRKDKYNHEFEGRNSRLDGLQAAILSAKLRHLDTWTDRRIAAAGAYRAGLADIPELTLPIAADWARHVYHLFVIRTSRRDALHAYLQARQIQTGVHYPLALPALAAYRHLHQQTATDGMNAELLSLPMGDHLTPGEIDTVIRAVRDFFGAEEPVSRRNASAVRPPASAS